MPEICNCKPSFLVHVSSLPVVKTIDFLVFNQSILTFEDFTLLKDYLDAKKFFPNRNESRGDTRRSAFIKKGTIADFQIFLLVNAHPESVIVPRELLVPLHPLLQFTLFPPLNCLSSLQF